MFGLKRASRVDQVKEALLSSVSYADGALRDRSLRADLRSAVDHASFAATRVKKDVGLPTLVVRLAEDRKLRKHVKALVEDLESASERVRGKRTHRLRNVLLMAGVGSLVVAIPDVRRWVSTHVHVGGEGETTAT